MVHPTSDRHVTHVCVFDVGSDLCLICGAGSKTTGQEELEPLPEMGLSAAYKVAKEGRVVRDLRIQNEDSTKDKHPPAACPA